MNLPLVLSAAALAVAIVVLLVAHGMRPRPKVVARRAHAAERETGATWVLEVIDASVTEYEADAIRQKFAGVVNTDPDAIEVRWRE